MATSTAVTPPSTLQRIDFMHVPVDPLTFADTIERFRQALAGGARLTHAVVNAWKVVMAQEDQLIRKALWACDVVNADGQGVVWLARKSGFSVPERVTGIDLMAQLLVLAEEMGCGVYLLGATDEVLDVAAERIRRRHPRLRIAGWRNGYFHTQDEAMIAEAVNASGADILLIGISSPKKEMFVFRQRDLLSTRLIMGVGGSFDIWAGKVNRAPQVWQNLGAEWLYRLLQEPGRMWRRYIVGNLRFYSSWRAWKKSCT